HSRHGSLHPSPGARADPRPGTHRHGCRADHPPDGRRRRPGRRGPCHLPRPGARLRIRPGRDQRPSLRQRRSRGAGHRGRSRPGRGPRPRGGSARGRRPARGTAGDHLGRRSRPGDGPARSDGRGPWGSDRRTRHLGPDSRDRGGLLMAAARTPSTSTTSDRSPRPAPPLRRILAHAELETRILLSNGEQLTVAVVLPAADTAGAATFAAALISTSFPSQAILTGFDRRNGVLRWVATSPLGRGGYLAGKILATLATHVLQVIALGAIALLIGWRPDLL